MHHISSNNDVASLLSSSLLVCAQSVAMRQLSATVDLIPSNQHEALAAACTFVHESISQCAERFLRELRRHVYVTPKSYLDLLSSYTTLLSTKRGELAASRQRLVTGVSKLEDTKAMVVGLQVCALS